MPHHRPIYIISALLNIILYLYIFLGELPKGDSSGEIPLSVNSTNPFSIRVPQSIAPSNIKVEIWKDFCPHPVVRVGLFGPEIIAFAPFAINHDHYSPQKNAYTFEVDVSKSFLPAGDYQVELSLLRCYDERKAMSAKPNGRLIHCSYEAEWKNIVNVGGYDSRSNYWAWVQSPICSYNGGQRSPECVQPGTHPNQEDYIFMEIDPETNTPIHNNNLVTLKDGVTTMSKPTSLLPTSSTSILKFFNQLSNYELVCWLGDDDAQNYYRSFLGLYPMMGSSGQRPFKFKYLKLTDTNDPTKDFSDSSHMTYNKCKILFISYGIDRFNDGISPTEYGQEAETLLNHIEKSHSDKTYPTWFLSPRSSTTVTAKASCIDSEGDQGRTPDRIHAFNEELRQIFRERQSGKPQSERHIHFMDNSDITEAIWHIPSANETKEDTSTTQQVLESQIKSTIAMRCMEKIAQQVKEWRFVNQIGTVNGLMRNGTLIPNDELYKQPYKWNKS